MKSYIHGVRALDCTARKRTRPHSPTPPGRSVRQRIQTRSRATPENTAQSRARSRSPSPPGDSDPIPSVPGDSAQSRAPSRSPSPPGDSAQHCTQPRSPSPLGDADRTRPRSISPPGDPRNRHMPFQSEFTACMSTLSTTMTAFTETVKKLNTGPSSTVTGNSSSLGDLPTLTDIYKGTYPEDPGNSYLDKLRHQAAQSPSGICAASIHTIDIVSDSLKKQIQAGRDVNLATLLIPGYDTESKQDRGDARLNRRLNIEQFRVAFGKYRRVMCARWPHRERELMEYEVDIGRIYAFYGDKFYDYHLAFASKSAEAIKNRIPVNWAQRDTDNFQLILGGIRARQCASCSSVLHATDFCPHQTRSFNASTVKKTTSYPPTGSYASTNQRETDRQGRKIMSMNGTEICNNFNTERGCSMRPCHRLHNCALCKKPNHGRHACLNKQTVKQTHAGQDTKKPFLKSD